jgi:putative toxin-antitoxin system antitoxin component (TIGR02293 family)
MPHRRPAKAGAADAANRILRLLEAYRSGVSLLQIDYREDDAGALLASIRAGLEPAVWSQLRNVGFTTPEIASVVGVNERTISRKQNRREPLDVVEGDRTMRLAQIALEAAQAFGDRDKALRWLRKPNRLLGGEKPMELITTEPGTILVRRALGMVEYGGVA